MRTAALLAALLLWGAAPAAAFDYTYVEGGVAFTDGDDPDTEGDGPWVAASLTASPDAHVFGHFESTDLDVTTGGGTRNVDEERWGIGVGNQRALSGDADLLVRASYEQVRTGNAPGSGGRTTTDNGFALELGARLAPVGAVELNGGVAYRYLDNDGDVAGRGGLVVPLTSRTAVTGEVRFDGDRTTGRAGLRLVF